MKTLSFAWLRKAVIPCVLCCMVAAVAFAAKPPPTPPADILNESPGAGELSEADCSVFINGEPAKPARGTVAAAVGPEDRDFWSAGSADGLTTFAYRFAFTKPVPVGSVIVRGSAQKVASLKPDAPYPGDPKNPDHWITADIPPRQSGRSLVPLPSVVTTRAVLFIDTRDRGNSELRSVHFSPRRLFNSTPLAQGYGDDEYTFHPFMGSPITYSAASLVQGWNYWQNHGPSRENRITTPDVSDINPSWFILAWDERQMLSGLWMRDNFEKFETDIFVGSDAINPRTGTEAEWKRVRPTAASSSDGGRLMMFAPVSTRGIRFRITQASDPAIAAKISAIHTLIDLGDKPRPTTPPSAEAPSPVQVKYTTEFDAEVSVVINRTDGTRVRNLIARQWRKKGEQSEPWDLKDQNGNLVPIGQYQWQVLLHAPLELKYEMTPYPNVQNFFEDRAPWPTGSSGAGGWATNHTPPSSVTAVGENIYVGSYVSEGGSALLEADLNGKKSWGTGNFAAWTGPQFLAGDGNTLYVQARVLGADTDNVYAVDRTTKRTTTSLALRPTGTRDRRVTGMVARDGKITLSSYAYPQWFDNAPQPSDVDFLASWPKLPDKRKERVPHEIVPDPRGDWLRLFRLAGTPPGQKDGDGFLTTIESTHGSGARQYAVLSFKRPIPIGSVIFPQPGNSKLEVRVSVLKPDAPFPPNPGDPRQWTPFETQAKRQWDVATAAPGAITRALRIAFVKGGDDLFTDGDDSANFVADDKAAPGETKKSAMPGEGDNWHGRLDGMKIMRRRFANLSGTAAVRVSSGVVAPDGSWDAKRKEPISPENPGVYLMEWKTAQKLRGLAFKEVDGKQSQIDIYIGPENATPSLDGTDGWETISSYEQSRRKHHWGGGNLTDMHARYQDGYVDFGKEVTTRAVRIRVVEQWTETGSNPQYGLRPDQGGAALDTTRCRIFGVAAMQYIGGEDPVDPLMCERIESFDAKTGKLLSEVGINKPGQIVMDSNGQLFAASQNQIVRVEGNGKHTPIVTDVPKPHALAIDATNNLYVFDAGARQNIRVYDPAGKYLRSIGEEGGRSVGPWNPLRMNSVSSIAVDKLGQVWATENNFWPKRVVQWGADGKFMKEILGPTEYGGGGTLDPWDKTRFFYGKLEFAIDWKTGKTALKSWYTDGPDADEPIHIGERTYLVNRPGGSHSDENMGVVYLLENGKARLVAAMGSTELFPLLGSSAARKVVGRSILKGTRFVWSDLNGDSQVQSDEIKITDMPGERPRLSVSNFSRDLSTQSGDLRYQVTKMLPSGVPVYEEKSIPLSKSGVFSGAGTIKLDNGNFISIGANGKPQSAVSPEGKAVWTYPTEGAGVHALYSAGPYTPQQVVAEFAWVGHETAHAGDLGEFLVTTGNVGTWDIWTADGILAGRIFHDQRDGRHEAWSMSEANRGLDLADITLGQEHFQGYFCKTQADNKYYAVAGHIHGSVVEVLGLDKFKRIKGDFEVTPKLLVDTSAWDRAKEKREVYQRSPVIDCYRLKSTPILIDPADWGFTSAEIGEDVKFSMGYTDKDLYVRYVVRDMGPLKNTGDQWDKLFKTGASVDLQIGVEPASPDDRKVPEVGDLRLLMTFANDKPAAVLFQPVVPGTPSEKTWKVVSPVAQISIDKVTDVTSSVKMVTRDLSEDGASGYMLQAAIPLELLGLKPAPGMRLRMDWGVLSSGKDGREVLRRLYWANKATAIVSDAPSEAAMFPNLWGHVRFLGLPATTHAPPETKLHGKGSGTTNKQVDELLDDMDNDKK